MGLPEGVGVMGGDTGLDEGEAPGCGGEHAHTRNCFCGITIRSGTSFAVDCKGMRACVATLEEDF